MKRIFAMVAGVGLTCCVKRPVEECKLDMVGCEFTPQGADLPPPGVLRLRYKGCMQSCGDGPVVKFHADMPQQECGHDHADECRYSAVYGEPEEASNDT